MKRLLTVLVCAAFGGLFASTASAAVSTCASLVSGGGINVLAINGLGGCTADGLLFDNFNYLNASAGVGTAEIDLTQNGVTINGSEVILNFNPNLGFNTEGGSITDLHFVFTVSGPVQQVSLQNNGSGAGIQENVCGGLLSMDISGTCSTTQLWPTGNVANDGASLNSPVFAPQDVTVWKDISVGNFTTGHLTSFNQDFVAVPEPMTLSLMGAGLLGIGLLGRRLRRK